MDQHNRHRSTGDSGGDLQEKRLSEWMEEELQRMLSEEMTGGTNPQRNKNDEDGSRSASVYTEYTESHLHSSLAGRSLLGSKLDEEEREVAKMALSDGESPEEGGSVVDGEDRVNGIYIDPVRDVDIAPVLHYCCGCLPCCCCLYSGLENRVEDEDEFYTYGDGIERSRRGSWQQPSAGRRRKHNPFPVNKNVLLMLIVSFVYGVADSLWSGTVLSVYILEIDGERNDYIGYLEAVHGLSALLVSFPLGYLSAKWSKSGVIKLGGCLFVVTAALNIWLLLWVGTNEGEFQTQPNDQNRFMLARANGADRGALATLWYGFASKFALGSHNRVTSPPLEQSDGGRFASAAKSMLNSSFNSTKVRRTFQLYVPLMALWAITSAILTGTARELYAESVPSGSRTQYLVISYLLYLVASTLGPLLSIFLFLGYGNDWTLVSLQVVLLVGMGLEILVGVMCFGFWDGWAIDENAEGAANETKEKAEEQEEEPLEPNSENVAAEDPFLRDPRSPQRRNKFSVCIPYVLFLSSTVISFGGGMTIKFFPLYFKNDIDLSPTSVQTIYAIIPAAMGILSQLAVRMSFHLGRVQTIVLTKAFGVLGLLLLAYGENLLGNNQFILVPIFILRTALMNSSHPLEKSVMIDAVEKRRRARWKSLDAVSVAAWAGGAAIGGNLVDRHDYTYTFSITAYIQAAGVAGFLCLVPLVRRREEELARERTEEEDGAYQDSYTEAETLVQGNRREGIESDIDRSKSYGSSHNEYSH